MHVWMDVCLYVQYGFYAYHIQYTYVQSVDPAFRLGIPTGAGSIRHGRRRLRCSQSTEGYP